MRHGGDLGEAMRRYGGTSADWLDLSTGISPWAWPVPGLADAVWRRLPSAADGRALIAAARLAYGVPDAFEVVAAPGTQALIQWLPRLAGPGAVALLPTSYVEHAASWRAAGHAVVDLAGFEALPADSRYAVTVEPNNPDGRRTPRDRLEAVAATLAARGGFLLIDASFADAEADAAAPPVPQAVTLRSFGKFYGLAGLRLGFAVAPAPLAAPLAAALGPWAVAGPALAIGRAALEDVGWATTNRARLARHAARLDAVLAAAGCAHLGGTAQFRLVRHAEAARLHARLAEAHIWVRRFADRADQLRFGCTDEAGLARLAAALAQALGRAALTG